MTKILMINYEFPPIGAGTANACFYMLKEFAKYNDLHIDLVTFSEKNEFYTEQFAKHITIHKVKAGKKKNYHSWTTKELLTWLPKATKFSLDLAKQNKYDLVHCWSGWPSGFVGLVCNMRRKLPYLVALRGSDIPGYNDRFMLKLFETFGLKPVYKQIWKKASSVTVLSQDSIDMAKKLMTVEFTLIRNGVNTEEFYPNTKLTFEENPIRFLYVGRLLERKGVTQMLEAIGILAKKGYDGQFVLEMVGEGKLFEQCKRIIKDNGIGDIVSLRGRIPHDDIAEIYRTSDVFILPSITEAIGNVTLEAIASGLPMITTDTGAAELIDGNGIIIPINNVEAIVNAMEQMLNDRKMLSDMKKRSIELATTMSWDIVAKRYYDEYLSIIARDQSTHK